MNKTVLVALIAATFAAPLAAHHGIGRFDSRGALTVEGTLTGLDFVNPHSYVYFEAVGDDGEIVEWSCEMRGATVLRRSGWSPDMFVPGVAIVIEGRPHRDDPTYCHVETMRLGDTEALERYEQLGETVSSNRADRPLRLPSGEINLAGDWAQEQYILAQPADGGPVGLVPISLAAAVEAGDIPMQPGPAGWYAPPVTLTDAGRAAVAELRRARPSNRQRQSCEITSVLFDWVFDGAINRVTQTPTTITMEYGRGLTRTVHLDMTEHPDNIVPSRAGHSIGHWDGDTLVVETVGFEPGTLAGGTVHSGELSLVERFTLNPETMELTRDYVAEDPLYFADRYVASDIVLPADAPFEVDQCKELAFEYTRTAED